MTVPEKPVLVTGATGGQGGEVVRALLAGGHAVRALVRKPGSEAARSIQAQGAHVVQADLSDRGSLDAAVRGVRAVFSVQMPPMTVDWVDFASERAQAVNLIEASRAAGVRHFVQSSTSGVGSHTQIPGWTEGRWTAMADYYDTKQAILDAVRRAHFERWTIIKPAFFMENFTALVPRGPEGGLVTILKPDTEVAMVARADIGTAAAAAFADPARFHEVELELAGDRLTMKEVAGTLAELWRRPVVAPSMSIAEAITAGMPAWGAGHELMNAASQPARPEFASALGIPLTTFASWAKIHMSR